VNAYFAFHLWPVHLSNPMLTAAQLLSYSAIQLFVERASARGTDFKLSDDDASAIVQYLSITLFVTSTEISRIGSMTADLRATLSDSTTKGSSGFRHHASGRMFRSWIKLKPLSIATFAVRHRSDCICLAYRSRSMAAANEAADRGSSRNLQIALAAVAR